MPGDEDEDDEENEDKEEEEEEENGLNTTHKNTLCNVNKLYD